MPGAGNHDRHGGRWPTFELVTFGSSPEHLRLLGDARLEVKDALLHVGVPRDFFGGRYRPTATLSLVDAGFGKRLLCFGEAMGGRVAVEPDRGEVLDFLSVADHPQLKEAAPPTLVNRNLERFTATVEAVLARFPYYSREAEPDELDAAQRELEDVIRSVDPLALAADTFWSTFLDDIAIGDFATEDVIAEPG